MSKDIKIILGIFIFVLLANFYGFNTSLKRERDIQRILDIGRIETGLNRYKSEYGEYPLSSDSGLMIACRGPNTGFEIDETGQVKYGIYKKPKLLGLVPCEWGKSSLGDAMDPNYPSYIDGIPEDPLYNKGHTYLYKSDGKGFEILASLELMEHKEFDKTILKRKIKCGKIYCNFGREVVVK